MSIGFGIIGCGTIAHFHARAIADVRGAKLVACYDNVPAAADRLAEATGCKAYHDLDAMLADPAVEVVTIGTPSGAHCEPAVAAARAGKHVIVEKPLEITLRRCDQIIEACDKAGVVLSTIFPSRFHESSSELKRAIEQGRFGRLTLGDAIVKWYRTQDYYDSGAWRGTWQLDGGGALMNQAIHSVDLLTWLMGPVVEVRATTALLAHQRIAVEDVALATVAFANGAMGIIEASTAVYPGYLKRIEIHGDRGLGRDGGGGHRQVGFRQAGEARRRDPARDEPTQEQRRRGRRPQGHRPSRPRPAVPGRAGRHQEGHKAADRRPRRPPLGRDHSGHLQGRRDGPGREAAPADAIRC